MYKHSPLSSTGYNRLVDFRADARSPRSNIVRSVSVCIVCKFTGSTFKDALPFPIAFGDTTASPALLRRVFGADNKNIYPREFSLVFDKRSKLKEAPGKVLRYLGFLTVVLLLIPFRFSIDMLEFVPLAFATIFY